MNKHIAGMCHLAFWAFLFLSPLTATDLLAGNWI